MAVLGQETLAKNIVKFGGGFLNHVNTQMKTVAFILDREVTKNISNTDHTLQDLAKLDHPYARRHGLTKARQLHDPYWTVHKQSGTLLSSKFSGNRPASINSGNLKASAYVGLNSTTAPYANSVVYGTSKMIPRPVLIGSRDNVLPEIQQLLKKNLKDFVVSYNGEKTK